MDLGCRSRCLMRTAVVVLTVAVRTFAVEPGRPIPPNSDPTYQQLRNITLSGEAVSVNALTLHRDAGTFHLRAGTVCFVTPVQGKVTGAVFTGDGNLVIDPPILSELRSLSRLTREQEYSESFSQMVLRFTDNTYEEIKKAGTTVSGGCDANLLQDSQSASRHALRYNLTARILQDVLSSEPGGLFVAFIHGKRYNAKTVFAIDPHGVPEFAEYNHGEYPIALPLVPEEVVLMTYDEDRYGYWAAFHLTPEYKSGQATGTQKNAVMHIETQQLDTTFEKNAHLHGKAITTVVSQVNGLRVLPFDLYRTLRVESVSIAGGKPLAFVQEDKKEDFQFFVILPEPLASGDKVSITTIYAGKDAVLDEGSGNYFPIARSNWYPSRAGGEFGDYTNFALTFRIPKSMKIAATGDLLSENSENGQNVTVWKTSVPVSVAGFNFGAFKEQSASMKNPDFLVQAFANEDPPDMLRPLAGRGALGSLSTVALMKKPFAEAELSVGLYTEYFGPLPFHRLAMTQQTACTFGQSWPQLVWLPICSFFDSTVRHQFGLDFGDHGYWKIVAPHEVAHQWWGHKVGFSSYRDQWMSEGFADMSASLFLQMIEKDPKKFIAFWNDERELLLQKNKEGFRGIDVGALTMGYRAGNTRTGVNITRDLIYPKGAYILHMLRMMMWDKKTGDQNFKQTMQDFTQAYSGRAATTEDFKAILEKHMTSDMKSISPDGKMDWFFDEYVYGTALPTYSADFSFEKGADGNTVFSFKITQSNVDQNFRMLVPIYLELANGQVIQLGRARLAGNSSLSQKVPIPGLKDPPKRAVINYFDDVLASVN